MLEHNGRFRMTLDVAPDGAVSTREFAITPRGSVLRERENDAVRMARAERRSQAMALVEPLQTPERLLETTRARAEALCPDLRRSPSATLDLAKRIRGKIVDAAVNAAAPLTMEQVQTRFDAEIDAFFTRIEAGAANVPDDRRAAFLRASLELSLTLPPALAQAAGQLAGSGTHLLRALFSARSGAEARDALENLDALVQGVSRAVVIDDAEVGEDELMTMQAISLLMSLEEMGLSEGDALDAAVNSLTRQGSPCRDALYDLLRIAGSDSPDDDVALTAGKLAKACATRIAAGNSDAAQNVLQRLSPQSIRERDLSLARQRELFGPGGFEARGGSLSSSAERATGQRPPEDIGRALSRHMQSMEAQCLKKAQDLLSFGTIVSGEQRSDPDLPLDEQFSKDYARDGVFVDGRYYSPKTPPQGTGTSEADFIALFPNPEHARQLSRLMNQTLHANMIITAFEAPELKLREGGPGLFMMASLDDPGLKDGGKNVQSTRVETLAAAAGRYRILGEFQTISRRDDGPERLLTGVVMEVALGDQPRVESVRLDYLLRGREVVPGEG
jgi:hypothetical protein